MTERLRILWLPHSLNPAYAGVRLRCLLPVAALRAAGYRPTVTAGLPPAGERFDVAIVQGKWLLDTPDTPAFDARVAALAALAAQGTRLVVDSFDNYFLNASGEPARQSRLEAYRQALDLAHQFIVSSPGLVPLLARELKRPAPIDVLGDPIETVGAHRHYESMAQRLNPGRWLAAAQAARLRWAVDRQRRSQLQLIWFGNHGSNYAVGGMSELEPLLPHLASAHQRYPLHLRVVSNSRPRYEQVLRTAAFPHSYVEWNRIHFAPLLARHDLVLIPNRPSDFTVAKSNNRLLLALSQGVPVMADPLPDYAPWRTHFVSGAWEGLPGVLADLPRLRAQAAAAQPLILARYGLAQIARDWVSLVQGSPRA